MQLGSPVKVLAAEWEETTVVALPACLEVN